MEKKKKVLLPVDPADDPPAFATLIEQLIGEPDQEVHVLHVIREPVGPMIHGVRSLTRDCPQPIIRKAESDLKKWVEQSLPQSNCRIRVLCGDPVQEILRYIRTEHMDMVIMGTHGRSGWDWVVHGSVAKQIIEKAPVPVLTVHMKKGDPDLSGPVPRTSMEPPLWHPPI